MSKNRLIALCIGCLCLLFYLPGILSSQTKQGYKLVWSTLNSGGNTEPATSANYTLKDAIGQPVVGEASSENYSASSGFWAAPQAQQVVGVEEKLITGFNMQETRLFQNFPNPFTYRTSIQYAVASRQKKGKNLTTDYCLQTTLKIFDLSGRLVRILVDGPQEPGSYKVNWDGKDNSGKRVAPGVYFYRLITSEYRSVKKLVVLK